MSAEQRFTPGTPINEREILIVDRLHSEWLRHYPEIAVIAAQQPTWKAKAFAVHPVNGMATRRLLNMLIATVPDATATTKNYPHPIRDEKGRLKAVVVHQTGGYTAYDSLYTYRLG